MSGSCNEGSGSFGDDALGVEELLRLNGDEDIEVLFFYNGRRLDLNTSIFEICREPTQDQPVKNIKELMASLSTGLVPGSKTIQFAIRDRPAATSAQRGHRADSLQDYARIRERTKSSVVDEMSFSSVNQVVQHLIEEQFAVFTQKQR